MKNLTTKLVLFSMVAGLVALMLALKPGGDAALRVARILAPARGLYDSAPLLAIALFCLLHLAASVLSLPGGCTVLNISSGAVFGFWRGCAIVYPVTMCSAVFVYKMAARFTNNPLVKRYRTRGSQIAEHVRRHDYFYLVSIRLSPLLPFGPLNVLMGLFGVPFRLYFLTTLVGIFFDVTLLNSIGAGLGAASGPAANEKVLAVSFALLFIVSQGLRSYLSKAEAK